MLSKRLQNAYQNRWIFKSKIEKNQCKSALNKRGFFDIDFSLIFRGFWEGFGGQNCRKIDIFGDFLDMFYETFIFLKNSLIFSKIADEKHIDFKLFLMFFFVFFRTLETLKIVLPSRRELNFCKIAFFALDEKRQRK